MKKSLKTRKFSGGFKRSRKAVIKASIITVPIKADSPTNETVRISNRRTNVDIPDINEAKIENHDNLNISNAEEDNNTERLEQFSNDCWVNTEDTDGLNYCCLSDNDDENSGTTFHLKEFQSKLAVWAVNNNINQEQLKNLLLLWNTAVPLPLGSLQIQEQ